MHIVITDIDIAPALQLVVTMFSRTAWNKGSQAWHQSDSTASWSIQPCHNQIFLSHPPSHTFRLKPTGRDSHQLTSARCSFDLWEEALGLEGVKLETGRREVPSEPLFLAIPSLFLASQASRDGRFEVLMSILSCKSPHGPDTQPTLRASSLRGRLEASEGFIRLQAIDPGICSADPETSRVHLATFLF
ncbi:hypothetical protein SODALDRAFT_375068 [Sodiomyces alkalinus F11]|uniref:Uncharacterized protein n=1 Tax=Sodiomyces alkalinus (strain CBS 110278 / VKM F-3762 / F11) TaxID=1314773 RepID=A0A3N2Q7R4_SODAK|nr:hypothetical protein SODALDRAFT_375068 [Sodiomyces alkalinus F11]ROT42804.1 hypothetical protein SODALDRAFT_375068 [Sodiomyces alkalinus F11]